MPDTRKRRPRETEPPKLDVPLVCRECGKETTAREGLVCDPCYQRVFWTIFHYDDARSDGDVQCGGG